MRGEAAVEWQRPVSPSLSPVSTSVALSAGKLSKASLSDGGNEPSLSAQSRCGDWWGVQLSQRRAAHVPFPRTSPSRCYAPLAVVTHWGSSLSTENNTGAEAHEDNAVRLARAPVDGSGFSFKIRATLFATTRRGLKEIDR